MQRILYISMRLVVLSTVLLVVFSGCKNRQNAPVKIVEQEDVQAKKMLQGIWVTDDEESVAFKVKGDTIYYPDSTSVPVAFKIIGDSLVLRGASVTKYAIVKQSAHLFVFKNQYGDVVRLVRSADPDDNYSFKIKSPVILNQINQKKIIKRDTVIVYKKERYHLYVQVNPTTYKIIKSTYNDEGVEVGNIYYDNIVHVSVYNGNVCLFSKDFHKQEFKSYIPQPYYSQCILSDIFFGKLTAKGVAFNASLPIPDSTTSYVINIFISFKGKLKMSI